MIQQGQVFKLKARCADGEPLWAWGALIRSSCKSTGFDPRLSLCTPRAEGYSRIAEETAAPEHEQAQITWRSVRARALARQGRPLDGENLAREAVTLAEATDNINRRGDTFMALGETLDLCKRPDDAAIAIREALNLYEQKGNVVSAHTARERLRELHR